MKSKSILLLLLPAAAVVTVLGQGPLTPPGAPAPLMKTLDQIEPRTPVSSLPFTISQPGSYYFTGNLQFTAATGNAITINVSDVSLDLMGFRLSSSAAVTGDAIRIAGGVDNIAVRNGTIRGNTTVAVDGLPPHQTWAETPGGFAIGINATVPAATGCHFSQLHVSRCRSSGLTSGGQALVDHVYATQNGGSGISVSNDSAVTHCNAILNGSIGIACAGGTIANCVSLSNQATGMSATSVSHSKSNNNGAVGISAFSVLNCAASGNGSAGISGVAATVANCTTIGNAGTGISAFGGSITNCIANTNESHGISGSAASISHCSVAGNSVHGILSSAGTIIGCNVSGNGSHGISADAGVISSCRSATNNGSNNGSVNIDATGATRTGNNPAP